MRQYLRRIAFGAVGLFLLARIVSAQEAVRSSTEPIDLPGLENLQVQASTRSHETQRYTLILPDGWWGPIALPHGDRFNRPQTSASLTVTYRLKGPGVWKSPEAYRQLLRSRGTISDSHLLGVVQIAGRYASRMQYSSLVYGKKKLYTDTSEAYINEEIMIPDPDGLYVLHYRALKSEFSKYRPSYLEILKSLSLRENPKYKPETYYLRRKHLEEELLSEGMALDRHHLTPVNTHTGSSMQLSFLFGAAGMSAKSAIIPKSTFKGGGGTIRLLYYLTDKVGFGIEGTYLKYLPEKETFPDTSLIDDFSFEFQSWIISNVIRINPWGKRRKWTPYIIGGFGSHTTHMLLKVNADPTVVCAGFECGTGITLLGSGMAWSAGLGFEKRISKSWSLTYEGRYRKLTVSGTDFPGTLTSYSMFMGTHIKFGHFRYTEHDVTQTRKKIGLIRPEKRKPFFGRRKKKRAEKSALILPGFDEGVKAPADPHFSYKVPLGWKGPLNIPGGVRYSGPGGEAFFSVAYHPRSSPRWSPPEEARLRMRTLGSISDSHVLDTLMLSDRFASRARYTSHLYRGNEILGEKVETYYTEVLFSPERRGNFVVRYRARKDAFKEYWPGYLAFLKSLEFKKDPRYRPGAYYRERDHILKDLIGKDIQVENIQLFHKDLLYDHRFQLGMISRKFGTFGFSFFGAFLNDWSAGIYTDLAAKSDFKFTGTRVRWHTRDTMSTGPYLFFELAHVTTAFSSDSELAEENKSAVGDRSAGWLPMLGAGYLWLWDRAFVDVGFGQGPGLKFRQTVVDGQTGNRSDSTREVRNNFTLMGGVRF